MDIIKEIGTAAMLEQLAEECTELGKAALKMARIIRKDNPTPVTIEQAKENLCEESGDVITCIEMLENADVLFVDTDARNAKIERWKNRIEKSIRERD